MKAKRLIEALERAVKENGPDVEIALSDGLDLIEIGGIVLDKTEQVLVICDDAAFDAYNEE